MQISAIRAALAEAASTVVLPTGALTCTGFIPDAVNTPAAFVADYTIDYDKTMQRGLDALSATLRVLVSRADDLSGQALLDLMLSGAGPASLKAALESARGGPGVPTLGGLAHDLRVTRVQGLRLYEHNGIQYLGAELSVDVIWAGGA